MLGQLSRVWAGWRRRLADFRADYALRRELAYELACLEQAGELEGSLSNLGLGRGAVPFLLENYPGAIRRHAIVSNRLAIATPRVSGRTGLAALFGSRRRCLLCPAARRCERWLRDNATGVPSFCPNNGVFERQRTARN